MGKSPDAFRTISEVSTWLETPAHVLRFWETKFPQIKPVKRAGGRRYYRPDDMALLSGIKALLHDQGMTIKGVQKLLRERGPRHVSALSALPWSGETIEGEAVDGGASWDGADAADGAGLRLVFDADQVTAEDGDDEEADGAIFDIGDMAALDEADLDGADLDGADLDDTRPEQEAQAAGRGGLIEGFIAGTLSRLAADAPAEPTPSDPDPVDPAPVRSPADGPPAGGLRALLDLLSRCDPALVRARRDAIAPLLQRLRSVARDEGPRP